MLKTTKLLRRVGVLLVGLPILAVGIVLIPLPGPGFLVCFIGLFVLSLEFEWARKYRERIAMQFKKIFQTAKERSDRIAPTDKDAPKK